MAKITAAELFSSDAEVRLLYNEIKKENPHFSYDELDIIFELALKTKSLFPDAYKKEDLTPKTYLSRWITSYCSEIISPPHAKIANPKSSCSDPAIRHIIRISQNISEDTIVHMEHVHNLFMSAENLQGGLLEEYIAVCTRPYGWIWCAGSTMKSIDFCTCNGIFLQIKNKSNTENSSSSTVRDGTTIHKWVRLSTVHRNKKPIPRYNWEKLNSFVNEHKTCGYQLSPCNMSENGYISFITALISNNHYIITSE